MRRHPSRAFALLLSLTPATFTAGALARAADAPAAPSAAPTGSAPAPADAQTSVAPAASPPAPAATSAPAPAQTPPASSEEPAPVSPAPAQSAPRDASIPSAPRPAPSLAPYPANPAPAARVQPRPLPPPVAAPFPDAAPPPAAAPIPSVAAWLGFNTLWIPSDGFDPYSENDALTLFDLGAALALAGNESLDVAAVVTWGAASSDAAYRTQAAELDVMRFSAGPELRGSIIDRVYWHGRLSPTATRLAAGLREASSAASFADTRWAFGVDAALGLDVRFAEAPTALPNALGFFLRVEAGYAWTQSLELELEPGRDAPVRTEPMALPELALGGAALRASLGAGF